MLLLFLGSTTFAFALILSAFLVCIALGGAFYARMARSKLNDKRVFTLLSTGMGLAILCTAPFYDRLAYVFLSAHRLAGENWWLLAFLSFTIVFAVMALPTIVSGALLPAAVAILNPGTARTGEGVGLVVLYNTLGAMLGSIVAGFIHSLKEKLFARIIIGQDNLIKLKILGCLNLLNADVLCGPLWLESAADEQRDLLLRSDVRQGGRD